MPCVVFSPKSLQINKREKKSILERGLGQNFSFLKVQGSKRICETLG